MTVQFRVPISMEAYRLGIETLGEEVRLCDLVTDFTTKSLDLIEPNAVYETRKNFEGLTAFDGRTLTPSNAVEISQYIATRVPNISRYNGQFQDENWSAALLTTAISKIVRFENNNDLLDGNGISLTSLGIIFAYSFENSEKIFKFDKIDEAALKSRILDYKSRKAHHHTVTKNRKDFKVFAGSGGDQSSVPVERKADESVIRRTDEEFSSIPEDKRDEPDDLRRQLDRLMEHYL